MPPAEEQQKIERVITFREKYLSFSGRIGRKAYFMRSIYLLLLVFAYAWVPILCISLFGSNNWGRTILGFIFFGIFAFVKMIIFLCVDWRRFKDLNLPGACAIILLLIPFIAARFKTISPAIATSLIVIHLVIFCFLLFKKGTVGENKYGPNPLNEKLIDKGYMEKLVFWPSFLITCAFVGYVIVTRTFPFMR